LSIYYTKLQAQEEIIDILYPGAIDIARNEVDEWCNNRKLDLESNN